MVLPNCLASNFWHGGALYTRKINVVLVNKYTGLLSSFLFSPALALFLEVHQSHKRTQTRICLSIGRAHSWWIKSYEFLHSRRLMQTSSNPCTHQTAFTFLYLRKMCPPSSSSREHMGHASHIQNNSLALDIHQCRQAIMCQLPQEHSHFAREIDLTKFSSTSALFGSEHAMIPRPTVSSSPFRLTPT